MSVSSQPRSASQGTRGSNKQKSGQSASMSAASLAPADDNTFVPCVATSTFLLYAQSNVILCLHHDTLAIERKFERHQEPVLLVTADNVSERGGGRVIASYDSSQTTILWDLITGDEIARFAAFEELKVAAFLRNGKVAFGNSIGDVIFFELSTGEHTSSRTIFDPITALAPAADCVTFAIGYQNGSILIASLETNFVILHSLSTTRTPTPLNGLAWHGSSSKQKSDMLAAQTADGDLRIWSIPKVKNGESPSTIRVLSLPEHDRVTGPCWFGWSKMGRVIQYSDGMTFVWDVRTKKVTYESVPTVDGIVGIANFAAGATLFTLGRNNTVQQYDLNPNSRAPQLVQNVQHAAVGLPPSPPISDTDRGLTIPTVLAGVTHDPNGIYLDAESSGEEGAMIMSPLRRAAQELEGYEDERRDELGALSPVSSRSSISGRSGRGVRMPRRSGSKHASGSRQHLSVAGSTGTISSQSSSFGTGTSFSSGAYGGGGGDSKILGRESMSIRSVSSSSSSLQHSLRQRQELPMSPEDTPAVVKELFPFTKARLTEVPFIPPIYDANRRTPDDLRRQMLKVVFGWRDDVESLIRAEIEYQSPGTPGAVLLAKWLGDLEAEAAASMVGSASLSSSDWMLLALSAMGQDSQKAVGEAFVNRLLAKGDIHPAVAILMGLGEMDEAVEAYVSRGYYMEAVLLSCLVFPLDWKRQCHLVRKWGEQLVSEEPKQPELAVRCFSCTTVESSEPWFSPRAQDAVYAAQQQILGPSPPASARPTLSPQGPARMNPAQAGLKLITNFAPPQAQDPATVIDDRTPMTYLGGVTPIDSAVISPGGHFPSSFRRTDPVSARTATPGGFSKRRQTSRGAALDRLRGIENTTPGEDGSRSGVEPTTAVKSRRAGSEKSFPSTIQRHRSASTGQSALYSPSVGTSTRHREVDLPSPSAGTFQRLSKDAQSVASAKNRNPNSLTLSVDDLVAVDTAMPSGSITAYSATTGHNTVHSVASRRTTQGAEIEMKTSKIRSIDAYINGLEDTRNLTRERTGTGRQRQESREGHPRRTPSEAGSQPSKRYVKPAKRSPSSPISMSPDDPALMGIANNAAATFDDERYYKLMTAPKAKTEPFPKPNGVSDQAHTNSRGESKSRRRGESRDASHRKRSTSRPPKSTRNASPPGTAGLEGRGRSKLRGEASPHRAESADSIEPQSPRERMAHAASKRDRSRARSARRAKETTKDWSARQSSRPTMPKLITNMSDNGIRTKKELAAEELEKRRLSLARRPSAPTIPHPEEIQAMRTIGENGRLLSPVEHSTLASPLFSMPPRDLGPQRSMSVDPEMFLRTHSISHGSSKPSGPAIGLPATPRAMRHPKYMGGTAEDAPEVPTIPQDFRPIAETTFVSTEPSPDQQAPPETMLLLPATTFQPGRSASVPAEVFMRQAGKHNGTQRHTLHRRGDSGDVHVKQHSPGMISIDESLDDTDNVIIVEASPGVTEGGILPELQHLAGAPLPPPPPPPPPMFLPNDNLPIPAYVEVASTQQAPVAVMNRMTLSSLDVPPKPPSISGSVGNHRRGRGSVSESMSQKFRNVTNRLRDRSTSRNRAISPPLPQAPAPYESVQSVMTAPTYQRRGSQSSTTQPPAVERAAPYESTHVAQAVPADISTPLVHAPIEAPLPAGSFAGYRNPKEIARQMTSGQLQLGAESMPPAAILPQPAQLGGAGELLPSSTYSGYRNPKEIRANMPPSSYMQAGTYVEPEFSQL